MRQSAEGPGQHLHIFVRLSDVEQVALQTLGDALTFSSVPEGQKSPSSPASALTRRLLALPPDQSMDDLEEGAKAESPGAAAKGAAAGGVGRCGSRRRRAVWCYSLDFKRALARLVAHGCLPAGPCHASSPPVLSSLLLPPSLRFTVAGPAHAPCFASLTLISPPAPPSCSCSGGGVLAVRGGGAHPAGTIIHLRVRKSAKVSWRHAGDDRFELSISATDTVDELKHKLRAANPELSNHEVGIVVPSHSLLRL